MVNVSTAELSRSLGARSLALLEGPRHPAWRPCPKFSLTILLERIATSPVGEQVVFKGGTDLRNLLFGAAGRFSEDLDFAPRGLTLKMRSST